MKHIKWLSLGAVALIAAGFLSASNTAQAGTRVSINIGGGGYYGQGYYRPVTYCPPAPCYAQPVYYQPAYCPPPRPYYSAPFYRTYSPNYGGYYARPVYYNQGYR